MDPVSAVAAIILGIIAATKTINKTSRAVTKLTKMTKTKKDDNFLAKFVYPPLRLLNWATDWIEDKDEEIQEVSKDVKELRRDFRKLLNAQEENKS